MDGSKGESAALESRLVQLEYRLYGNEPLKARWREYKETHTSPNYPGDLVREPVSNEIGDVTLLEARVATLEQAMADLLAAVELQTNKLERLGKMLDAAPAPAPALAKKLEVVAAFLEPLIDGSSPPLDGAQIATKAYVDDAQRRLAGALRDEAGRERFRATEAYDVAKHLIERLGVARDNEAVTRAFEVARKIRWLWDREEERYDAEQRRTPTRIESLVHAITGRGGGK